MLTRRQFSSGCIGLAAAALGLPRFSHATSLKRLATIIEKANDKAFDYLQQKQSADGAWRSEVYGPLKDGPSLTAFVASSIAASPNRSAVAPSLDRAASYLAAMTKADDTIEPGPDGITYPVYAAAGAVTVLSRCSLTRYSAARAAWLNYLRDQQLNARLGWRPDDLSFGGWSFAHEPPTPLNGQPRSPLAVPNLSATVFAIDALQAGRCEPDDPAIQDALIFVRRCQNWADDEANVDARFEDGGFFFLHDDPIRNKPGEAGVDIAERVRYVSYGSTTADGLRALIACGLPLDNPRIRAARHWLTDNFSPDRHPGDYPADREHLRPALYFYYAASVAEALHVSRSPDHTNYPVPKWTAAIALDLISRQHRDGSWINSAVDVREDDPLVATPLAIRALASCSAALNTFS